MLKKMKKVHVYIKHSVYLYILNIYYILYILNACLYVCVCLEYQQYDFKMIKELRTDPAKSTSKTDDTSNNDSRYNKCSK